MIDWMYAIKITIIAVFLLKRIILQGNKKLQMNFFLESILIYQEFRSYITFPLLI